jgi:hypothetical protein
VVLKKLRFRSFLDKKSTERTNFVGPKTWYTEGEYYEDGPEYDENDIKLHSLVKPASFSNMKDPHPHELLRFPEIRGLRHKEVSIDGEDREKKYIVYWAAFSLDTPDYLACKARSEITFVHIHVLVPTSLPGPRPGGDPQGDRNMEYSRTPGDRMSDVYCVRLTNGKYVRVEESLLKTMYAPIKALDVNKDNVLKIGGITLSYMPPRLYAAKKEVEMKEKGLL